MLIHSVEFNVFERFKDFRPTTDGPVTTQAQGISFFLGSPMGKRIREHAEPYADKAGVSCFDDALYCVIPDATMSRHQKLGRTARQYER
jgi:hypothetical protein